MNTKTKVLKKILANQIWHHIKKMIAISCDQQHIKQIKHHDHISFIPDMRECFNIHKSINAMQHINRITDKNQLIISIDAERAFENIQHSFLIKT
jgi:cell wall assembly regulator SMI1